MRQYVVKFYISDSDKILDAIKAVDTGDGVLLIVKNYAGDVMNFEMAQEMAQMEDIKVERVIVNDDIAVSDVENVVAWLVRYSFIKCRLFSGPRPIFKKILKQN